MSGNLSSSLVIWLRCFDAVARNGSFTQAANELHVTQGSVSQQVRKLEDYMGVTLFHRARGGLSLTGEGVRLAHASGQAFLALDQAVGALRQPRHGRSAALSLNCSPSFAMLWLTPRIGGLLQECADLSVRIYGEFHLLDREGMTNGNMQAGIRYDPGGYVDVRAEPFLDEWLVPVASPAFMARHPGLTQARDLPASSMLHDELPWSDAPAHAEWNAWLAAAGHAVARHEGPHFNLSQLAMVAALNGQGVAMGRLALVAEELRRGNLVAPFPFAVASPAAYHYIVAPHVSSAAERLGDWLRQAAREFVQERDALLRQLGIARTGE